MPFTETFAVCLASLARDDVAPGALLPRGLLQLIQLAFTPLILAHLPLHPSPVKDIPLRPLTTLLVILSHLYFNTDICFLVPSTMTDWRYMPVILVSDFEENPPVTTRYTLRNNELDFEKVYVKVNQLCDHTGRGRLEAVGAGAEPGGYDYTVSELNCLLFQNFIFERVATSSVNSFGTAVAVSLIISRTSFPPTRLPCRAYGFIYWTSYRKLPSCLITTGYQMCLPAIMRSHS